MDTSVSSKSPPPTVTPEACRAGRALLGWSMRELARRAGVSLGAVQRLEAGTAAPRAGTALRIRRGFEACGVELVLNEGWTGAVLVYARRGPA